MWRQRHHCRGTGAFDVQFQATATAAGTFVNPDRRRLQGGSREPIAESDETNNTCSDSVSVAAAPVLAVTKSHLATIYAGADSDLDHPGLEQRLRRLGQPPPGATVTVTDVLPSSFTFASFTGTGWSCAGPTTVTCTTSAVVAGRGASFNAITLTVNVPANSATSVSNTASVYGGGDPIHHDLASAQPAQTP